MEQDAWNKLVADIIKSGKCPFDVLPKGEPMAKCPLGFPGCACAAELMLNPYLQDANDLLVESNDDALLDQYD